MSSTRNTKPRSTEFLHMLETEYNNGKSMKELSKKYKTDCYFQFKTHGIKRRNKEELHNWRILHRNSSRILYKWDCSSVNNEKEAYILGLLMADGYVGRTQFGLRLKKEDKDLLVKIKNYFSGDITLQESLLGYSFVVSSINICNNLKKLGIISKKSLKELHIPQIEKPFIRHFIRGFFDGDGTIFIANVNGKKYLKGNICSPTKNILVEIQKVLQNNSMDFKINKENRIGKELRTPTGKAIGKSDMYRLEFRKKTSIKNLINYLYTDATIYLNRKFLIFNNNKNLLEYKYKHANTELTQ